MKRGLIWGVAALALAAAGAFGLWRAGAAGLKSTLAAQVESMDGAGVRLSYAGSAISGFPFSYRLALSDVRIEADDGAWRLALPWTHSTGGVFGGGSVRTEIAPEGVLDLTPPSALGLGDAPLRFQVRTRDLRIDTPLGGATRSQFTAEALTLEHRAETGVREALIDATGLSGTVERFVTGAEAASLTATRLTTAFDLDPALGGDGRIETVADGVSIAMNGRNWRVKSVSEFVRDGEAEIVVTAETAASQGPGHLAGGAGASAARLRVGAGRIAYSGEAENPRYTVSVPELGGRPFTLNAARSAAELDAPIAPSAAAQAYRLSVTLDQATADEALWTTLDPEGLLARDPVSLNLEVGGAARMLVDIAYAAESRGSPVVVETVEVTGFSFDGLGVTAQGDAALRIIPGAPTPDGRVHATVNGWRPALDALVRLGVATPDLAIFLESIAETLNRPDAEPGVFSAQIELREGMVFANGERVQ